MIISKTPYRISFFGGGSDYPEWYMENGGKVISTTIDKHIYISARYLPPFFKHKYRIVWSKLETVKNIKDINHNAIREMLKLFKINDGLEIHYDGDLPARSGIGSSSVFVVGLINLLRAYIGKNIEKKSLAKESIYFEQKILKEVVGSQDQIAASFGGFNKISFKKNGNFTVKSLSTKKKTLKKLNKNLLLIYTGIERNAHDIAKTYVNKLQSSKKNNILRILSYVDECEAILKRNDLDDFGRLLHESWLDKKDLNSSVTNNKIEEIYNFAMKKGATGGKVLGAGGGGFILFYVPYQYQKRFIKSFKNFKRLINIPFNFNNEGSSIIFNNKKMGN